MSAPDTERESLTARAGTRFILVRHAESEWNAAGRWQGHADPPLSEAGRAQARVAADRFSGERVDRLVCSDLARARETAAAIAAVVGMTSEPRADLRELDVGIWSGKTRAEIESLDPELLREFDTGRPDVRPGGGESRGELRARVLRVVEELASEQPGAAIVVVAHLGVVRALASGSRPGHTNRLELSLAEILRPFSRGHAA